MYFPLIKRLVDVFASLVLMLLLGVPFLLICAVCAIVHGFPVFYTQERPGLNAKVFKIYKLRTMKDTRDENGLLLPDKIRLTTFGIFLRKFSIDELPGLWNVFKGDMSLVGPRPLLVEYLSLYSLEQARRHDVRPGITGWAQVNGRNAISWQQKFEFDVWYVDNLSFLLDVKIILMTVKKVLVSENVNQQGQATMTKFTGND